MVALHRHQLVRLTPQGWQRVRRRPWDAVAAECLAHWASHGLPLVVTRQRVDAGPGEGLAVGLAAPTRWERRRIALSVPRADVAAFDEFPHAALVAPLLQPPVRAAVQRLCAALDAGAAVARVHGSHGWQLLTGLDYVRAGSDVDLCVAVAHPHQADAVAALLDAFPFAQPRLDVELAFPDGAAVAWREWLAWRAGRVGAVLVKRLDGCSLQRPGAPGAPGS